jgi:hypothetical protein
MPVARQVLTSPGRVRPEDAGCLVGCTTDHLSMELKLPSSASCAPSRPSFENVRDYFSLPRRSRASGGNSGASMSFWADSMQLRARWAGRAFLRRPEGQRSRAHLNLPFPSIVKKRAPECRAACMQAHFLNEAGSTSESRCGCGALLKRRRRRIPRRLERVDAAAIDPCGHTERHVATRCNIVRHVAT